MIKKGSACFPETIPLLLMQFNGIALSEKQGDPFLLEPENSIRRFINLKSKGILAFNHLFLLDVLPENNDHRVLVRQLK